MAEQDQIHIDDFTPDPPHQQAQPETQSGGDWWAQNAPKPAAQVTNSITKTSAPPVPRPPLPWELRTDAQKHQAEVERKQKLAAGVTPDVKPLTPYQGFQAATNIPVVGGLVQTGEGIAEALRATSGPEAAKGATKAIGGALDTVVPLAGESILAKPAEAAISGIAGWATQEATQAGLKKLGIKPEYADLAGSLTGLLSAYAAGKIRLSPEQTTLVESLQGKEVPDQVAKLQKLATDPGTTQGERDAASAFLKKKYGIDHPAFKPAEQAPEQQPLPLKPEASPVSVAPETSTPSLNQDVPPVRGTYPPQPEPAEVVPPTIKEAVQGELSGKPKAAATPAPEKPAAAAAEAESGVSGPNAGEPVKADSGGSGAGVEDNEVAPGPQKTSEPEEINTSENPDASEEPESPKKPLDLSIYKLGSIIHDTAWKEDLKIVNSMSMGSKMEYQVIPVNQLEPDGSVPMSGGNKWWISPDERYELKEEAPNKSAKKEEWEPEPEPKKPETPLHPVGTILKNTEDAGYVKVVSGDSKTVHVVWFNPSTGKPWISAIEFDIPKSLIKEWTKTTLPESKEPAPAATAQKPIDMDAVAAASQNDDWLANWFKPGNVLKSGYWGNYDKVIEYKPNPNGGWGVKVIRSDKEGNPVSGEKERWHSTPPSYNDSLVKYDPSILAPKTAPPAPKASQTPVAVSGAPTKEPPTLKGYKKKIGIPKKYEDNDDLKLKLFGATNSNSIPSTDIIPTKIAVMNLITPKLAHLPAPKGLEDIYYESNGQNLNEHQKAVAGLIHSWASTSADSDKHSLVVQIAAQKEFGLALDWDFKKGNSAYEEVLNEAYNIYGKAGTFIRQFLRTQYQETQAYFKQNGVKEVVAYRGMSFNFDYGDPSNPFKVEAGSFKKHQASKVQLQPLSSFSFDAEIAAGFSGGNMGALIAGVIPVGRILSTPKTGMGCLREFELVVLSGDSANNKMAGVSWNKLKATQYLPLDERLDMLKVLLEEVASKETGKPKKSNAGPKVSGKVSKPTD